MATLKYIRHRILSIGILCFLCLLVAAEPFRIANASLDAASTMACCVSKTEGHCDSGVAAKKIPPPKSEPMCGLKGAELEDDGITIVAKADAAEPKHAHSQTAETTSSQPAAETASLSSPCQMDCGACATTASRQQKRERSIVQSKTYQATSLTTASNYEDKSLLFASSDIWPQIKPRGPPARH